MSTIYFLVFLLGLLVFSTAEQNEGSTTMTEQKQRPFLDRLYMRGWPAGIQKHLTKSTHKSSVVEGAVAKEASLNIYKHATTTLIGSKAVMPKIDNKETTRNEHKSAMQMKMVERRHYGDKSAKYNVAKAKTHVTNADKIEGMH